MTPILGSLLDAIDDAKVVYPNMADYPKMIGSAIALKTGDVERLHEWVSMLEDANTPMKEIMAIARIWNDSTDEAIAYYVEITDQLKEGLHIAIDAVGY